MQIIRIKPDLYAFIVPGKDLYFARPGLFGAKSMWDLRDTDGHLGHYPTLDAVIYAVNDIYEEDTE